MEIEYEHIPDSCNYCNGIGHSDDNCKRKPITEVEKDKVQSNGDPRKFVPVVEKQKDPILVTQHTQRQPGETSGVNKHIMTDITVTP